MYKLYIHINKFNNKKYIGITTQKYVSVRWKNGLGYSKCPRFFNAILKYGWDNFEHIVLFDNLTQQEAEILEKYYIRIYKTTNDKYGYNIQNGGGITHVNELTKNKAREKQLGKHHSDETKKKMSLSHKGKQKCLGYKHTQKTKDKHRLLWIGTNNCRARGVNQYDLDGNFIKHYNYMNEIKTYLNIPNTSHISDCCRGKRKKCYGYIWKYDDTMEV